MKISSIVSRNKVSNSKGFKYDDKLKSLIKKLMLLL